MWKSDLIPYIMKYAKYIIHNTYMWVVTHNLYTHALLAIVVSVTTINHQSVVLIAPVVCILCIIFPYIIKCLYIDCTGIYMSLLLV